jgi:predicted permease
MFLISAQQVVIMFCIMLVGMICRKIGFLRSESEKDLSNILCFVISPCLIVNSFRQEFSVQRLALFGELFLFSAAIFLVNIVLSQLLLGKRIGGRIFHLSDAQSAVMRFGSVYTNCGFIGFPLVQSLVGDIGVFYAVPFNITFNIFVWSHGVSLFGHGEKGRKSAAVRKVLTNPNIIATAVGLTLFLTQFALPFIPARALELISGMNTPLSMLVIGANLAGYSIKRDFTDRRAWLGVLLRNFFLPLVTILILTGSFLPQEARLTMLVMSACPVGGFTILFSNLFGLDKRFPTRYMCLSTILSVLSVPAVILAAQAAGL